MKKTVIFILMLVFSLTLTLLCQAKDDSDMEPLSQHKDTNPAVGIWEQVGISGEWLKLPGASFTYYLYPDGTVTNSDNSLILPASLSDDGSFTVDTSGSEEWSDYTVTGNVMPLSQESLDLYNVHINNSRVDFSDNANQLILTLSYPDPSDPLAGSPAVTSVYFLRKTGQSSLISRFLRNKVWKVGDHILNIDSSGSLDLDDGEAAGKCYLYEYKDPSLYLNAKVVFRWDTGGIVNYIPVMADADTIHLQNIDKPEEILILEYVKDMEKPEPAEEICEEAEPFVGEWEIQQILKNDAGIAAEELLLCESMTAQINENGTLLLKFSNGFTADLKPDYQENSIRVKYNEAGFNMDWKAVLNDDGTVTAAYDDYTVTFVQNK